MSTFFIGEGNIGSKPQFRVFPNGNDEPRKMMRLNVRFDNPVLGKDGYQDRGGFWAPVEIWHKDAEHWGKTLYQQGMRVLVEGRMISQEWEDQEVGKRVIMKVEARKIGILPNRISSITLAEKSSNSSGSEPEPDDIPDAPDELEEKSTRKNKGQSKKT